MFDALWQQHRPLVAKGRLYLPLALWERITGDRFEWEPGKKALGIRTEGKPAQQPS